MHLHPSTELSGKPQGRLNSTLHLLYIGPSSCTQWRRMQARDSPTLNPWQAPQVDAWCWEQLFSNCVVHALLLLQPPLPLSLSTCCLSSWEDRLGRRRRGGIGDTTHSHLHSAHPSASVPKHLCSLVPTNVHSMLLPEPNAPLSNPTSLQHQTFSSQYGPFPPAQTHCDQSFQNKT